MDDSDSWSTPSPSITRLLEKAESPSCTNKPASYRNVLDRILDDPSHRAANLTAYLRSVLGDNVGIVASRPLLSAFIERFRALEDTRVKVEVGQRAWALLQPRVVSFEEQDTAVKEILADAYEAQEDYVASALTLQAILLDSSQRAVSDDTKAKVWMRIVRCYLEEEDPTSATGYLNRVKNILFNVQDKETRLQFALSNARINDAQRNFLDASQAYHRLSLEPLVDDDERLRALSAAVICAVLVPAGPQRARLLAQLYKDDRASQVEEFGILEKIFLDRLLAPAEVKVFAQKLAPHQLAKTADGSTVLEKAVLEHNLLGASRLYVNIPCDTLGALLGVDSDRAEQYAAQMIEQGRLAGHVDQIDRVIFFEGEASGEKIGGPVGKASEGGSRRGVVGKEMRQWDANVAALTEEVERVASMIQNQYPDLYEAHMVH